MSYYTAPYNLALAALRLSVATRGNAVRDPGLRQLIEQELQIILARKPEMRPAVLVAYATASAEGKHLIESIVQEADPSFLMQLQKKTPRFSTRLGCRRFGHGALSMRIPENKAGHIGSENPIKTSKLRAI